MNKTKIGAKLRSLRGNKTQETVANDVGIGRTALNMYELGHRVPRDDVKVKLAIYYNVSVEELFFADDAT